MGKDSAGSACLERRTHVASGRQASEVDKLVARGQHFREKQRKRNLGRRLRRRSPSQRRRIKDSMLSCIRWSRKIVTLFLFFLASSGLSVFIYVSVLAPLLIY